MTAIRRPAARRGGPVGTTVGVTLAAGSYAALLAAGPRLLGTYHFGGLAIAWTVAAVFGFGLATPTEQLITRRLNVGAPDAIRPALSALGIAGAIAAAGCIVAATASSLQHGYRPFGVATVVAIASWVALAYVRARLAGAGDLTRYAGVLIVESTTRVAFVLVAVLFRSAAGWLLGLAIGVPLAVAAAVGLLTTPDTPPDTTPDTPHAVARGPRRLVSADQVAFLLVSLGFQACLNGPALVVGWREHTQSVVGAFVAASTYFRAPTILMGGIVTHALVALSHAWATDDAPAFRAAARRAMITATGLTAAVVAVLAALEPVVLRVYYGHAVHLPTAVLVGLAVSSVLTVAGGVAVQPLLASGRNVAAGAAWASAAIVTLIIVALPAHLGATTAVGLIAGPLVAVAVVAARSGLARSEPPSD